MWNRKDLKERAKIAFKANYWKCILVAIIMSLILGGDFSPSVSNHYDAQDIENLVEQNTMMSPVDIRDYSTPEMFVFLAVFVIVVVLIVCAIAIPLSIFLLNPLIIGCRRYFTLNLYGPAQIKEIGYCFDTKYLQNVKIMFFKDLFTFLWSLLFIIPGIIKSYEYRMIPYILAEHDEITMDEAFALSKKMMDGNKWAAFVLDLSFLGWHILSAFTFGILGIFYVSPYVYQTEAALYDSLKQIENNNVIDYNSTL